MRLMAVIGGGYFLTAALVSLGAAGMAAFGMAGSEAVILSAMLGYLVYLGIGLWGFAERRPMPLYLVTLGGAALAQGLVYWLSPMGN